MKRNDFLIVDPQGNVAIISKEDARKLKGSQLEIIFKSENKHTNRDIESIKSSVEKYLKVQWLSKNDNN